VLIWDYGLQFTEKSSKFEVRCWVLSSLFSVLRILRFRCSVCSMFPARRFTRRSRAGRDVRSWVHGHSNLTICHAFCVFLVSWCLSGKRALLYRTILLPQRHERTKQFEVRGYLPDGMRGSSMLGSQFSTSNQQLSLLSALVSQSPHLPVSSVHSSNQLLAFSLWPLATFSSRFEVRFPVHSFRFIVLNQQTATSNFLSDNLTIAIYHEAGYSSKTIHLPSFRPPCLVTTPFSFRAAIFLSMVLLVKFTSLASSGMVMVGFRLM